MRYFGVLFLFFVIFGIMTPSHIGVSAKGLSEKEEQCQITQAANKMHVKVPKVILRKYSELSAFPDSSYLYRIIPVKVLHIIDDIYEMTSSYKVTNSTMNTELWMEFPNIAKSRIFLNSTFLITITPLIENQNKDRYMHCFSAVIPAKGSFPDGILELKFDITDIHESCFKDQLKINFKYMFLFSSSTATNIDLSNSEVFTFLLLKEKDGGRGVNRFLPDHVERLHYENIIRHVP